MFHSVTICGKNSWTDYHMVPVEGIYLPGPPELKSTTIDLKASNGKIDISTLLTGYPVFNNRTGSLNYYLLDPWDYEAYINTGGSQNGDDLPSAYEVFSQIMADIHGQYGTMYFEDDPEWEYEGRFTIDAYDTTQLRRNIQIKYDVKPYKMKRESTSITLTSLSSDMWAYNDLDVDVLGYMPNNPKVTVTGLGSEQAGTVRILYPGSDPTSPYVNPDRTIDHTTGVNITDKVWADFLFYRKARLAYLGPAGTSATFTFNQGRL